MDEKLVIKFVHTIDNICRSLLQRGLGDSYVSSGDFIGFMYLDQLGQRLGEHGTAGLKRVSSLSKKDGRRGNGGSCAEGARRYLYALQIRDIEGTGVIGNGWEIVRPRA